MRTFSRVPLLLAVAALVLSHSASAQVGRNVGSLLDPNLATREQLASIPGLSAAAVAAIEAGRPYLRMSQLNAVIEGQMSAATAEEIYRRLWLHIDLNDATDAEILMVPGVGDRMLREFKEYRPYVGLAQFEREMAKYVDQSEVARLAQYVYVRIDLNTASDEAITSIPGIGSRMLREFKEYRPYTAMAQFRREMAKYVDANEVERMARYVEIR
jgi:DNA uptake protein ComE-like DNA-binding protein